MTWSNSRIVYTSREWNLVSTWDLRLLGSTTFLQLLSYPSEQLYPDMTLPRVRENCSQHGRRNRSKFLVIFLRRSSAVGSSFLNTLPSNTSHRKRLAESRTETGVARLLPRKETLISFQGPVRLGARHYFWFKITAGHLLVIQLIQIYWQLSR